MDNLRTQLKAFGYMLELQKSDLLDAEHVSKLILHFEELKTENPELAVAAAIEIEALNFLLNKMLKVLSTTLVQGRKIGLMALSDGYVVISDEAQLARVEKRDVAIEVYLKTIQKEILKWA